MIEIKDITKTYGSGDTAFQALKGISFTIKDGEFIAIMGPSGSGKSTLMHILGCLDTLTTGTYFLDGKDVSTLTDEELAEIRRLHVGFVFQSFNLLPRTTVMRNVMLPLIYAGVSDEERDERSRKVLSAAGMTESHFSHLSNQLSGGQIQRVAIARALVNDPSHFVKPFIFDNVNNSTAKFLRGDLALNRPSRILVILCQSIIPARCRCNRF
ncbi:MAG: hypothetical protein UY74_C0005G0005 [Candidatus Kaiserbacteria bacterium GW2011_GWC2_52_8b]|uniref:ABC transporter domain-containing protein n=1 Tax=Candidatus Kaiserbacteria bacterium GW2011_GWC2_52_8b TaxID=1618676 RepID=A0A0G2AH05_9BACT|nr:MAG: hypothetical protein UY74_C0005G0005 [Candidatus Kaiserbacteria bacterium GW2011_GWC2_52_8b]